MVCQMKKIISYNVAGIRARINTLISVLEKEDPDVVFLQEIKATDENFPFLDISSLGYQIAICGQKGFNGVAILSKNKMKNIIDEIPNFPFYEARFIQAEIDDTIYISVYAPNGCASSEKLAEKLRWYDALNTYVKSIDSEKNIIMGGDFNVIEKDTDVYNSAYFKDTALMIPPVREKFSVLSDCLINSVRLINSQEHLYSFWDFQGGCWPKNNGILLDTIFISKNLKDMVENSGILKEYRGVEKPSDHTPVFLKVNL